MSLQDKETYKNIPEFIERKFQEHGINKISLTQSLCYAVCNRAYIGGYRKWYEVYDGRLIILDGICFNNVLDYYDYLDDEDKKRFEEHYDIRMKSEKQGLKK